MEIVILGFELDIGLKAFELGEVKLTPGVLIGGQAQKNQENS